MNREDLLEDKKILYSLSENILVCNKWWPVMAVCVFKNQHGMCIFLLLFFRRICLGCRAVQGSVTIIWRAQRKAQNRFLASEWVFKCKET